jgi:hypothetical protein
MECLTLNDFLLHRKQDTPLSTLNILFTNTIAPVCVLKSMFKKGWRRVPSALADAMKVDADEIYKFSFMSDCVTIDCFLTNAKQQTLPKECWKLT